MDDGAFDRLNQDLGVSADVRADIEDDRSGRERVREMAYEPSLSIRGPVAVPEVEPTQ